MTDFKELEKAGNAAVKELRANKLMNGIPFMINSNELLSTECYLEYPDGHISLVSILPSQKDFHLIRNLSEKEILVLRKKYNLLEEYA